MRRTMRNLMMIAALIGMAVWNTVSLSAEGAADPQEKEHDTIDPLGQSDSFSAVLYNNTNGLPTSEANVIAQTADGFIWIGSYGGLIRYDGNTFERMDSALGIGSVVSLTVDSHDRLWIGTNDNGVAVLEKGRIRFWNEAAGLKSAKICGLAAGDDGRIYIGTTSEIAVIGADMELTVLNDPELEDIYVGTMNREQDGRVYGVSSSGDLFVLSQGKLIDYISREESPVAGLMCVLQSKDSFDKLYMGTQTGSFFYGNPNRPEDGITEYDISPLFSIIDIQQYGDQIWLAARNGIGVIDKEGFHLMDNLPMNNSVGHIMSDYEGNLWFVSTRQGVMKIVPNSFLNLFERYGLPEAVVNSTCMLDGRLFVGTDTGLIVLNEEGAEESIPLTSCKRASGEDLGDDDLISFLYGARIRSIIKDSRDRLWISTWRARGLVRYDHGEAVSFNEDSGLLSDHIRAVCEREDGAMLVVGTGGISVIQDETVIESYGQDQALNNMEMLCVENGQDGDILAGSNGDGIYVISPYSTAVIGKAQGLSSGVVMKIKWDPEHRVYWLVTGSSIAYMTEDYKVHTITEFPYSNNFDLYKNSNDEIWVLSSDGIYVTPAVRLLDNKSIQPVHYSLANGMSCTATSNSYSELTDNGDLYIAGSAGVIRVNIEKLMENVSSMKVSLPFIEADGTVIYPDDDGSFTIGADVQKLTVYCYVFNYMLTDPQVSYSLEGFDKEETKVLSSTLAPVTYTNLPGGTYSFTVHVHDSLGQGNRTISVPIIKNRTIFESGWFYALSVLAVIGLIALSVRLYIRKKTAVFEKKQQEAVQKERLNTELKTAKAIQYSMMPHDFPQRDDFNIYALMDPARDVGGDFYDFFQIDDNHLCLVIADVSGKGVPASLFMMISKVILQSCAMLGKSAAEILDKTNEAICSNNKVEMFVTIWLGIVELSTGIVKAANAGHEYPAVMQNGRFELLKDRHGLVIGGMAESKYKEYELQLQPGDKLFIYTDGVPEATAADNSMFGTDRMLEALNREPDAEPEKIIGNVRQAVDDFVKDAEQFDDLTMLCFEYHGTGKQ